MRVRHSAIRQVLAAMCVLPMMTAVVLAGGGGKAAEATATDSMGPMKLPGITLSNFGLVDGHIYRGEQPQPEEYSALKALGVTTIIDLRNDSKDYARTSAEAAGLKYINIPMNDKDRPYDDQIAAFIQSVTDPTNGKVYVHCAGGRHRTGATIAVYRMAIKGWSAEAAYREMKAYDYYSRWGHGGYKDYVFEYYDRMQAQPASVPVAYGPAVEPSDSE